MCLAIYARKCDIDEDELRSDALALIPLLDTDKDNLFTKDDVIKALEAYNESYCTFPIKDIANLTQIKIPKNKRNGRKRADHIKLMNFVRDEINNNKDWRNKDGRPSKQQLVAEWQQQHPEGRKADCHRDTGIDPKTIRKWWGKGFEE